MPNKALSGPLLITRKTGCKVGLTQSYPTNLNNMETTVHYHNSKFHIYESTELKNIQIYPMIQESISEGCFHGFFNAEINI